MVGATGNSAYPAGARQIPSSSGNGLQLPVFKKILSICQSLSVPSSSGNGLQLRLRSTCMIRRTTFSPLLIGERSATSHSPGRARGSLYPFSPLLIGERSATIVVAQCRAFFLVLSVPSSSGNGLQRRRVRERAARRPWLSVPSSSGNGLQRRVADFQKLRNRNFQSPPHRGTVCND